MSDGRLLRVLGVGGSVVFLVGGVAGDTRNSIFALLLLAASYPAFRLTRARRA